MAERKVTQSYKDKDGDITALCIPSATWSPSAIGRRDHRHRGVSDGPSPNFSPNFFPTEELRWPSEAERYILEASPRPRSRSCPTSSSVSKLP